MKTANKIFRRSLAGVCLLVVWSCAGTPAQAQTPQPIVDYNFDHNPADESEINTGNDSHHATLGFKDSKGAKVNLHSAAGLGVSGQLTDYAFDNSASVTMGPPGPGGLAISNTSASGTGKLISFTITGWFKTLPGMTLGAGARFFDTFGAEGTNVYLAGGVPLGSLNFGLNGSSVTSLPVFTAQGAWVFFAVTYDSSSSGGDDTLFYAGSAATPVSLVSSSDLTKRLPGSLNALCIGNRFSRDRPFKGYIDDFKIFGSSTDGTGALPIEQIQAICTADKTGPSPAAPASPKP